MHARSIHINKLGGVFRKKLSYTQAMKAVRHAANGCASSQQYLQERGSLQDKRSVLQTEEARSLCVAATFYFALAGFERVVRIHRQVRAVETFTNRLQVRNDCLINNENLHLIGSGDLGFSLKTHYKGFPSAV